MTKKKILIVDDSEAVRSSLKKIILQQNSDLEIEVCEADNGTAGFELFEKKQPFALIFSDYNMPNMNGLDMCKKIKEKFGSNAPPMILLTTQSNPDLMAEGKKVGVTAWVIKPMSTKTLIQIVERFIKNFK
ncbi:MAG: response regulator [Oligoflexia bacterium]|nr:response regulator [Oligoflexia bacterium]